MKKGVIFIILSLFGLLNTVWAAEAPQSIRQSEGAFNHIDHVDAQFRLGYISLDADAAPEMSSFAAGGHLHMDTKRYLGIMAGVAFYTVQDMGFNSSDPAKVNPDFFDKDLDAFSLLGEAFLDGKWGKTSIRVGRQVLDTPHADSDDIRMIPDLFSAYTITNNDINGLTITAGLIDRMAGWENEIDASEFINVGKVMGIKLGTTGDESTDGAYIFSANYNGIENFDFDFWAYKFDDLAYDLYFEVGYLLNICNANTIGFGLQYDNANDTGDKLAGVIDANTWGVNVEAVFEDVGLTILAAYNQDNGDTGAFTSLGGGPFFTSIEDQTLDAIGGEGIAYIFGVSYALELQDLGDLIIGSVYGKFEADDTDNYDTREIDIYLEYNYQDKYIVEAAYAKVDDLAFDNNDFDQFRLIISANF